MTAVAAAAVAIGAALLIVAAVGLVRLPDAFARANAVTKAAGLGVCSVLVGSALLLPTAGASARAVLAVLFQLVTVPVAGYAVARAAHRAGTPMVPGTRCDEAGRVRDALPVPGRQRPPNVDSDGG